jgi:hypothetical protein
MLLPLAETTVAPWWGVPVIAGVFLLTGTLIGFVSNHMLMRKQLRREDHRRWDNEILNTALLMQGIVRDLLRRDLSEWPKDEEGVRVRAAYLGDCARQLNEHLPRLRLIASKDLIQKAQDLFAVASAITLFVDEQGPNRPTSGELTAASEAFAEQVRRDVRAQE